MVGCNRVCGLSQHFWDGEDWHSTHRLGGLGPLDQKLKIWGSNEDGPPAGVPRGVKLGSRQGCQVQLPEHGEEAEGEAHRKAGPRAPRLGVMEQRRWSSIGKDRKMSEGWHSHGDVGRPEQAGHLEGLQGCWRETHLLVEGPDSRNIVANATC